MPRFLPPSFRTYNRTTTADEAAAEEQFLESTPWANPRHPSIRMLDTRQEHHACHYQTPAGQRRAADLTAPNGSASTIEVMSNPSPSAAYNANGRLGQSESPVLQMKRAPNEHAAFAETPSSHPRHSGPLVVEGYSMMSSPGGPPRRAERQRWSGGSVRPLNVVLTGASSGQPSSGRPDAARVPLTQRSTVSVGNGLFGR